MSHRYIKYICVLCGSVYRQGEIGKGSSRKRHKSRTRQSERGVVQCTIVGARSEQRESVKDFCRELSPFLSGKQSVIQAL